MIVIDAAETFLSRPCLQQRSIHGEVLVGEQTPLACLLKDSSEESVSDVPVKQALAVLGEHSHIPNRIVHVQTNEPAEQQVVIQLLHQHALAAHGIKHLEQERTQQLLRCYRGPTSLGVQLAKPSLQLAQRFIGHGTYRT